MMMMQCIISFLFLLSILHPTRGKYEIILGFVKSKETIALRQNEDLHNLMVLS